MNDAVIENYKKANPKRNVAVIGLRNNSRKILLVRTRKLPDAWQPVGGGIKAVDTSAEGAVIREVKEEIGIDINPSSLNLKLTVPYDFGEGNIYFFEATLQQGLQLSVDSTEILECRWFNLREAELLPAFPATKQFLKLLATENS